MDKILFIVPPNIQFEDYLNPPYNTRTVLKKYGNYGSVLTDMPMGALSISAYLKKHARLQTKLVDFNVVLNKLESFDFDSFRGLFRDFLLSLKRLNYDPNIVAISALFTPAYQHMLEIAECCCQIFPGVIILGGGSVATNMYKEIFEKTDKFNALCYGEGEKPMLGLVAANDKLQYLKENPAWITLDKIKNSYKFKFDFIENLDEIPFYDYGLLEVDDYRLNPAISAYASLEKNKRNFHVITSRGCPFRCCFCASHTVHGRSMRYYSLARVREDFKRLKEEYGAEILVFQDDHFLESKQRALAIIALIRELKITAVFQNGLALYALDREMLEALKNAGINQLLLSVESGSERVLKEIMHKPLNLSIIRRVTADCRELGIYTNVNILIGLPGETKQDIEDARAFLKTIYANWFLIFCANPLVGSEMYEICIQKNYVKESHIGSDYKKAVIETGDFSAEFIQEMAYVLNLELNFVENSDFRLGNYEAALNGFKHALEAKNDHAIAYYYAASCYEKLGDLEKFRQYLHQAQLIFAENPFWYKYAKMFNIL